MFDSDMRVVVLVGGVGGAKLAHGLAQILPPEQLTVIVNTADDLWYHGLRVCPDLDTVMYTLAGLVDKANGWGLAGDTRQVLDMLGRYGTDAWFGVGDRDIATHLLRTQWWHEGVPLTGIMQRLTRALGIGCRVLPMTDAPVATKVQTVEHGELDFQTYFVKLRWQPTVIGLRMEGIAAATMSMEVRTAIDAADVILFGPSNPWLSIAPILAMPGMKDALMARDIPRVAVTPIVAGQAIKGPASKIMQELGYEVSAAAVAIYYGDVVNGFVYDEQDANLRIITPHAITMNTIMQTENDRATLAREVLNWIVEWKNHVRMGNNPG